MFENYKVARYFSKIILSLSDDKTTEFSEEVKKIFNEKVVSGQELPTYKITFQDIDSVLGHLGINVSKY